MFVIWALILVFCYVIAFCLFDLKRKRTFVNYPAISFVVPCYNNSQTVSETIKSIYYAYRGQEFELIVINDGSGSQTSEILKELKQKYSFEMIINQQNVGKANSLNNVIEKTKYDMVLFLDSDVIVNKKALNDVLARFENNAKLGAVSCPYTPKNHGFLPLMQKIEYVMKTLVQGSYNPFSAISLWGGFLAVKKEAFIDAGSFSTNAIVEDVDLAFKLNRKGWKVEQSFVPVRTYVPDNLGTWYRQKKRWVSGSLQCLIKHRSIWIKNPLQVVMVLVYGSFIISSIVSLIHGIAALPAMLSSTDGVYGHLGAFEAVSAIFFALGSKLLFSFFSIPYVIPLIQKPEQLYRLFYVIPFAVLYYPALFAVSVVGIMLCLFKYRRLERGARGW